MSRSKSVTEINLSDFIHYTYIIEVLYTSISAMIIKP
jgi:hypothetical protein